VIADGKVGLLVDAVALYWGVRRLVFDHTSNQRAVSSQHQMIEDSWKRRKAAGLVDTIEGRESGELLFNGKPTPLAALKRRMRPVKAANQLCSPAPQLQVPTVARPRFEPRTDGLTPKAKGVSEQSLNKFVPNTGYQRDPAQAKALKNQRDSQPALSVNRRVAGSNPA
jgi:hypothetical protein